MDHCTATADPGPRMPRAARQELTADEQRDAAEAWDYARPVIERWRRARPLVDFEGYVAERITGLIPTFDGARSHLRGWAEHQADYACRDAARHDTGVIRFGHRKPGRPAVWQLGYRPGDDGEKVKVAGMVTVDPPGRMEQADRMKDLLRGIGKVERIVLLEYYWHGRTMKQIGESLGLCDGRISQIHAAVIDRLREVGRAG